MRGFFICNIFAKTFSDATIFSVKNTSALFIAIAGFISAIFASSFLNFGISSILFLALLSIALFLSNRFFVADSGEKQKIFLIALFLVSFATGAARYGIEDMHGPDANLEAVIGQKAALTGIISDEVERKESGQMLTVDLTYLATSTSSVKVSGRALVSTGLYPEFAYGDEVNIYGILQKPKNFSANASTTSSDDVSDTKDFDYVSYLAKDGISYTMDFSAVSFLSAGHGNALKTFLFKIKNAFIDNLNRVISEPESGLAGGILLGTKSSIDKETTNIFRIAGLSHIVALSGYNITIVAEAIARSLSFLPRAVGLSGGVIGIILFVIMSGSSSTAVRAGIMSLIVILAQITRRDYQIGRALAIAALLMIMVNPKILVFDISFQLSFLATIAIIYVAPIVKSKFAFVTEKFGLRDTISATISAQILVLPWILYKMGLLSIVALPANILVLAFIPASMFFGFATGMFGFVWIILSLPFAWITYLLLDYMIKVSGFFARLPFSSFNMDFFSLPITIACYSFIAAWFFYERKKLKQI